MRFRSEHEAFSEVTLTMMRDPTAVGIDFERHERFSTVVGKTTEENLCGSRCPLRTIIFSMTLFPYPTQPLIGSSQEYRWRFGLSAVVQLTWVAPILLAAPRASIFQNIASNTQRRSKVELAVI